MKPWVISAVLVAVSFAQEPQPVPPMEYPGVLIRESQEIVVNGLKEDWRLEWAAAPKPFCEPNEISLTCPCMGFAYGESGDLFLVRLRAGREIERLHLTPFFSKTADNAVVQKRAPDYDKDFQASARSDFETLVSKRPIVQVMHFADYDHGGVASEFYVQTEAVPCGKSVGIVVGISRSNPQLHVFGKETDPDKPLFMQKRVWEALVMRAGRSKFRTGPVMTTAKTRRGPCCSTGRPKALTAHEKHTAVPRTQKIGY